jgi:hypothetical protein
MDALPADAQADLGTTGMTVGGFETMVMNMNMKAMRRMIDRDLLLHRLGLETRTPTGDFFTGLGLFSVGVLLGAGLGLLFAPKRGNEMRSAMTEAWRTRQANRAAGMGQDVDPDLGVEGAPASTMARP